MSYQNLAELDARVVSKLGRVDSQKLEPTQEARTDAIRDALDEYSALYARRLVTETAGDGTTRRFVVSTLLGAEWVPRTSQIDVVQRVTDAGTDDELIEELDDEKWDVRVSTAGEEVLHLASAIGFGETLRVVWTRPHEIEDLDSATTTTIPERDREAVLLLCVSSVASWIARTASDFANHSMGLDQVDYRSVDSRWRQKAADLREAAARRFGVSDLASGGAAAAVTYETTSRLTRTRVAH